MSLSICFLYIFIFFLHINNKDILLKKSIMGEKHMNHNDTLTKNEVADIFRRLSGKTDEDESKIILSYQSYALDEPEDSVNRSQIYTTDNPYIQFSFNYTGLNFLTMDVIFRSFEDPELKLLWGRLQRFKKNASMNAERDWIFYINILEKANIEIHSQKRVKLLTANIVNPELFFLTREIPSQLTTEQLSNDNTLYGGNMIRMLIPLNRITFQENDDVDTEEIDTEVYEEIENDRFVNSQQNETTSW